MQKNNIAITVLITSLFFFGACIQKHDDHQHEGDSDHKKEMADKDHAGHKVHDDDDKHAEHDDLDKEEKHPEHDKHGHSDVSTKKAVIKTDEKKGIQLSPEAEKTIGLKMVPLNRYNAGGKKRFKIPASSLVRHEFDRSCYLQSGPWYRPEKIRILENRKGFLQVEIPGARNKDKLVVAGAPLLRLSYLEAFGASGHGHGH